MGEPTISLTLAQLKKFGTECAREGAELALVKVSKTHRNVIEAVERSGAHKSVFSVKEAASYANRSEDTIRQWISDGMQATKRGNRGGWQIRREDLDDWRMNSVGRPGRASAKAV